MSTEQQQIPQANSQSVRKVATCDQEAWVKARIETAIKMGISARALKTCGADEVILNSAIEGIVNGASVEIIHTLGMEPEYTNLRRVSL